MASYWQVVLFSLIGGVFSLWGGLLLLGNKRTAQALARYATPFAAGVPVSFPRLRAAWHAARKTSRGKAVVGRLAPVRWFPLIGRRQIPSGIGPSKTRSRMLLSSRKSMLWKSIKQRAAYFLIRENKFTSAL